MITSHKYSMFIIEGIDRLGKDTLISNILNSLGYHTVLHYEKPKRLNCYNNEPDRALERYQVTSFNAMFELMRFANRRMIFNRSHIGEYVYAPRYRKYSGAYVFGLENDWCADTFDHVKLILLSTSNFDFIQDDGHSFDFAKKAEEQEDFKEAFERSILPNKAIVDVHNGNGGYRDPLDILDEVLQ